AHSLAIRDRTQFELHLQGPDGRREASRSRAGRALCAGRLYGITRRAGEAVVEHEKALALNPNFAIAYTYQGSALAYLGRCEEALLKIDASERLSPRGLFQGVNSVCRAVAHFSAGQYLDAISCARKSILESPGIVTGYRMLVVNCALIGEIDEARAALK